MKAIVLLLLTSCASTTTLRAPCAPCLQPASGPIALDAIAVRELLAGVALEEGDLAAQRDEQAKRADIAESYAANVQLHAALGGTGGAILAAVIAALATWGMLHK